MRLRWHPLTTLPVGTISPTLHHWLAERHSLTRRLRRQCGGAIRVEVVRRGWHRPYDDEASALELRAASIAMIREVFLYCDDQAQIYARSVIPLITLEGTWRRLKFLGAKPLGDLLFADPAVERRAIEITELQPNTPLFETATQRSKDAREPVWGRRSVFHLQGKPLLVSEFFLPGLCSP